jgi:SAM-dependent methyltransferase
MWTDGVSRSSEGFCCPACRSELTPGASASVCATCGCSASRLAPNLLNFLAGEESVARAILTWPLEFIQWVRTWVEKGWTNETLPPDFRRQLTEHGLIRPDGSFTSLGSDIRYHVCEIEWQAGQKGLDGALELDAIGPRVRVLDAGCGAGQTLRLLEPDRPVELFGVDTDLRALALGCQLARLESIPITFAAATAHALPFREGSFDLVMTRVALNYMQQRRALTEMARVLRPGGFLFCRVERIWHDFALIARSPTPAALICRCRDFGYGVIHSLAGLQPTPGSTLRGGRAFATARRLSRILNSLGCHVVRVLESPNGPTVLGHRSQLIVVARKEPALASSNLEPQSPGRGTHAGEASRLTIL